MEFSLAKECLKLEEGGEFKELHLVHLRETSSFWSKVMHLNIQHPWKMLILKSIIQGNIVDT